MMYLEPPSPKTGGKVKYGSACNRGCDQENVQINDGMGESASELERLRQQNARLTREVRFYKSEVNKLQSRLQIRELELSQAHLDLRSLSRKLQNALHETSQAQDKLERTQRQSTRATQLEQRRLQQQYELYQRNFAEHCAVQTALALKLLDARLRAEFGKEDK